MKLLFGQFTQEQIRRMQDEIAQATRWHASAMIMPYFGDRDVQVVELPRQRKPRRSVSIYAHCAR